MAVRSATKFGLFFFFNDTATTEIYTLSLHDALPISEDVQVFNQGRVGGRYWFSDGVNWRGMAAWIPSAIVGLLFANYPPLIEGPFRNAAGGGEISLPERKRGV